MTNVVALKPTRPCESLVATLRRIADEIEQGEEPWATGVLLLGNLGPERDDGDGGYSEDMTWRTYGFGPRNDIFTVRGLMATCLNRWNHE